MDQRRLSVVLGIAIVLVVLLSILFVLLRRPTQQIALPLPATSTASATSSPTQMLDPTPSLTASATFTAVATITETPTPFPSETPTDIPTATVVTATFTPSLTSTDYPVYVQVVAATAYFRTGPGRVYSVITQTRRGNKILLSGISQDRLWYMFSYAQGDAWISGDKTVTMVIMGDINTLPVIPAPPTPTPGASSGGADAPNCDLYASLSAQAQNDLLQQVYNAIDANDWETAGKLARGLYRCSMRGTFYLLYDIYLPSVTPPGKLVVDRDTAFSLFSQGWQGK